jgi:hypothetical protein
MDVKLQPFFRKIILRFRRAAEARAGAKAGRSTNLSRSAAKNFQGCAAYAIKL